MGGNDLGVIDGAQVSRRDFVKVLGAAGLGTAAVGSASGQSKGDPWMAQHTDYGHHLDYWATGTQQAEHVKTLHRLHYLGANWAPYTSPAGDGGSWQHTFLLTGLGLSIGGLLQDGKFAHDYYEPTSIFESTTVAVEALNPRDPIAISPRRDDDLFAFTNPNYLDQLLEEDAVSTEDGDPEYLLSRRVGSGWGPEEALDPESVEEWQSWLHGEQQDAEDRNALMKFIFLEQLGKLGTAIDALSVLDQGIDLILGTDEMDVDPRTIAEGFEKTAGFLREGEQFEYSKHAGLGHTVMFDVYVPPGETANFAVRSSFSLENEGSYGYGTSEFEAHPSWKIDLHDLATPSSDEPDYELPVRYGAGIDESSPYTNVPVSIAHRNEEVPDAKFSLDKTVIEPGESFSVDGRSSEPVQRSKPIEEYRWSVLRYFQSAGSSDAEYGPAIDAGLSSEGGDAMATGTLEIREALEERHFAVVLTVKDEAGRTGSKRHIITVPPSGVDATLTLEPNDPAFGEQVTVDASESLAPEDAIYTWSVKLDEDATGTDDEGKLAEVRNPDWDLGGETSEITVAEFRTEFERVYDVTVTVTDGDGRTDSVTKQLTIGPADDSLPTAVIDVNDQYRYGGTATFDGTGSQDSFQAGAVSYEWFVAPGADPEPPTYDTATAVDTGSYGYWEVPEVTEPQQYTVWLVLTDEQGYAGRLDGTDQNVALRTFEVRPNDEPAVEIETDYEGKEAGENPIAGETEITFEAVPSGDGPMDEQGVEEFRWYYAELQSDEDIGADPVYGNPITHTFDVAGERAVELQAVDRHGLVGNASTTITVDPVPDAPSPEIDGPSTAEVGQTAEYTVTGVDSSVARQAEWQVIEIFEDGDTEMRSHTGRTVGVTVTASMQTVQINVSVVDEYDNEGTAQLTVDVTNPPGTPTPTETETETPTETATPEDPVTPTISGDGSVSPGQERDYTAGVANGDASEYYFDWTITEIDANGGSNTFGHSGDTYTRTFTSTFDTVVLRVDVAHAPSTGEATKTVSVANDTPTQAPTDTPYDPPEDTATDPPTDPPTDDPTPTDDSTPVGTCNAWQYTICGDSVPAEQGLVDPTPVVGMLGTIGGGLAVMRASQDGSFEDGEESATDPGSTDVARDDDDANEGSEAE